MSIYEYDEEKHIRNEKMESEKRGIEIGEKRGIEIGEKRGLELVSFLLKEGKIEEAKQAAWDREKREEYYREYNI